MAFPKVAKAAGVKNVVSIHEIKQICPDRSIVPQKLDLSHLYHDEIEAKASYKKRGCYGQTLSTVRIEWLCGRPSVAQRRRARGGGA